MKFKETVRYHIDFRGRGISPSAFFAGFSFFLLAVYYFGIVNLRDYGVGRLLFSLILPMVLLAAFMVMLVGIHFPVTPVYGALGALYCLLMVIRAFSYGNVLLMILGIVWYILAGALYLGTSLGLLSGSGLMTAAFLIPVVFRLVFVDVGGYILKKDLVGFLPEAAALSGLAAFALLALCMKPNPRNPREKPEDERILD